jgi:protein involved in polysaccharide export with SLBB domain
MRFLVLTLILITSLFSISTEELELVKNVGNIGELQEKLDEMKNSPSKVSVTETKVAPQNNIEKKSEAINKNVGGDAEDLKKSIFDYRSDNSIVAERDKSHVKYSIGIIERYGDKFFKNRNSLDSNSMPIPKNYKINKGDIVSIWIYGGKNKSEKLEVDRNGNINIDGVGPIYVYNLEFGKLQSLLSQKYEALYKSVKIHVDLDRTTPIQITIAGEINSPGIYNISAFSTIKDAILLSGGVSTYGSYREIRLLRNGKIIKEFDLYKLIKDGETSYINYILESGDAIIVPRAKRVVSIGGEVRIEAKFELKEGENLQQLLEYCGGLKVEGSNSLAKLVRIESNKKRVIKEIVLSKNITLANGDFISILPINKKNSDSIYIYGNVVNVGERGFSEGLTLYDFFKKEVSAKGLENVFMKNSEMNYSVIRRYNSLNYKDEILQFSLLEILSGKENLELQKGDEIYIFNRAELKENPYIYIHGTVVTNPGKYQFFENMRLKDIENFSKFRSEITIDGERRYLQLSREVKVLRDIRGEIEIKFLHLDRDENFSISPFDEITFYDTLEREKPKFATIRGEVLQEGEFVIDGNTDINKLIQLAKGLKKEAYLQKFEVVRYWVEDGERKHKIIETSLEEAIKDGFKIEEFDEVTIFRIPNWSEKESVIISGEVRFPGKYTIQKGDTLQKVLERAGGILDNAFLDGAIFTRNSIKKLQRKMLEESIRKLKTDSLYLLSAPSSIGENGSEKAQLIKIIDSLVLELNQFEPNGRVTVDLKNENDFVLEGGDSLYIPTINETVTVIGEVLNPNSFFYKDGLTTEDYLDKSGGLNNRADIENIYIIHPNGEAYKYERSFLFGFDNEVRTGDTIVVPLKVESSSFSTVAKDVSQILYQFAITAVSLKTVGVF